MKSTWPKALIAFFIPLLIGLSIRWMVVEPFVIPSGSMIPELLIHDHIIVKKFFYGLKLPFTNKWIAMWRQPSRGDIVVFKYPPHPEVYYIKRLIGKPGDEIFVQDSRISINGKAWSLKAKGRDDEGYYLFEENSGAESHTVRFAHPEVSGPGQTWKVPAGQYFMMGDNRDQSYDSRFWNFVPEENLVAPAWMIWLSCDAMLASSPLLCDPTTLRSSRIFQFLNR